MRTKLIAILVAGLFAEGSAWAADDSNFTWTGSAEVGGRGVNTDGDPRNGAYGTSSTTNTPFTGPEDKAKAQEYQDVNSGLIDVFDIRGSNREYYLKFYGENFGRDDQYIDARGGAYGIFKAQVYSNWMPHNYSYDALSPLSNPTGVRQLGPGGAYPPAQNPATWNSFDYGVERKTAGGNIEFSNKSPFYVRADYSEVTTNGTKPGSAQLGTGSGNGFIELGFPVQYKTTNSLIEAGYNAASWNIKLGYLYSKFGDDIKSFDWTNFYMGGAQDTSLLPQNNELKKWSLNASVRDLPLDSTFTARATYSKLTDNFNIGTDPSLDSQYYFYSGLKPIAGSPPAYAGYLVTAPDVPTFNGEHKTTTVAVTLASTLTKGLESRLYYNYYDKANDSTVVSYAAGSLGSTNIGALEGEQLGYTKNEVGVDLTYRFDRRQKLMGGYNYVKTDRDLDVADRTEDNRLWIEYRNTMVEDLDARLKYDYLQRRSDIDHSLTYNGTANPTQAIYYYSPYDVADFDQNRVKLSVDWSAAPMLDIGVGAILAKRNYKDNYYGRTDDKRQEYDFTIAYGDPNSFRITGIGNWGKVEFNQAYRQGAGPLPSDPQTAANYNWGSSNTQKNWMLAVQGDWVATDQLSVMARASWLKTDGGVDFWSGNTDGGGGFMGGPLVNYPTDNTKTQRFLIRADYKINKSWTASAGYAYENYDYSDGQMLSYQGYYPYYMNLGGTNNSYLTGAFANPSYTNNIFFATAKFMF
jgi:hypothetical protein